MKRLSQLSMQLKYLQNVDLKHTQTSTGFELVTSALPVQFSCQKSHEATVSWRRLTLVDLSRPFLC